MQKDIQKKCKIIYIKIHPRDPKIIAEIIVKNLENIIIKLDGNRNEKVNSESGFNENLKIKNKLVRILF